MSPIEAPVLDRDHPDLAHQVRTHGPFDLPRDVKDAIYEISTRVVTPEPEVIEPISESRKVFKPQDPLAPKRLDVVEHNPRPHTLRTAFDALSPRGRDVVNFQRSMLSMAGGGVIAGHTEVVTRGGPTVVTVFIEGDRINDVMGGRLHKNEAGRDETVVSVPIMSTGVDRAVPQIRR